MYNNKDEMKEKAIGLYLQGKNYTQIGSILGCSRNYVSELIKEEHKIKEYKNTKIIRLYKNPNYSKIVAPISLNFWEKIGISKNADIIDNVEISVDEIEKIIIIKKH